MKLGFITSSNAGDFFALIKARDAGIINFDVSFVLSTDSSSDCYKYACNNGIEAVLLDVHMERSKYDKRVMECMKSYFWDYCFLAGYKYLLPDFVINKYRKRIINSHHSILPAFPGLYKKEKLVVSNCKLLGATVHYVDEGMDTGEIIAQASFPNYGIEAFDRILKIYRHLQDILILNTFMILNKEYSSNSNYVINDVLFSPAVDMRINDENIIN